MTLVGKEINDKDPKFKIRDIVRTLKYKNIFAKGYTPNWVERFFVIKKLKILCHGHIILYDVIGEEIVGTF